MRLTALADCRGKRNARRSTMKTAPVGAEIRLVSVEPRSLPRRAKPSDCEGRVNPYAIISQ